MPFLRRTLRILAALVLAAAPLASQDLLFDQQRLDLGSLFREGDHFGSAVALSGSVPCNPQKPELQVLVVGAVQAGTKGTLSGAAHLFTKDPCSDSPRWVPDSSFPATAPETAAFDAYGYSVAVSGDGKVVAVGAPLHDELNGNAGAVYVWQKSENGEWKSSQLNVPGALPNDQLGTSVALNTNGTVLVAGAPQPNPDNSQKPYGKVYLFERSTTGWGEPVHLTANDGVDFDFFGFAVAVSGGGSTVVVGAPGYGTIEESPEERGAAYVFEQGSDPWSDRSARALASGETQGAEFGASVAISSDGQMIAVGARSVDGQDDQTGQAYVFRKQDSSGDWVQEPKLLKASDADNPADVGNRFGAAVSVSAFTDNDGVWREFVLVGAPGTGNQKGAAYLFQLQRDKPWRRDQLEPCTGGDERKDFGQSVALSFAGAEAAAIVGAPADLNGTGSVCAVDLTGLKMELKRPPPPQRDPRPGQDLGFDIRLTNRNSAKISFRVTVTFDETKLSGASLSCPALPDGAECSFFGKSPGQVFADVTLEKGVVLALHFYALVNPAATGLLVVTIEVSELPGVDLTPDDAEFQFTLQPKASLTLKKEVNKTEVKRGQALLYTITVSNSGPSLVPKATVTDEIPSEAISSFCWKCEPTKRAICPKAPNTSCNNGWSSGPIHQGVTLPPNSTLTYLVEAQTVVGTLEREVRNTASVTSKLGSRDDSATTKLPLADLSIEFLPIKAIPGDGFQALVKVFNDGPDFVEGAKVIPSGISGVTWECPKSVPDNCTCSSSKDSTITIQQIGAHECRIYTMKALLEADFRSSTPISVTVEVVPPDIVYDPEPDNNKKVQGITLTPTSPLVATLSPNTSAIPGNPLPHSFTVSVTNSGPSDLLDSVLNLRFPAPFTAVHWECMPQDLCTGSGKGNIRNPIVLPVGKTIKYRIRALIDPSTISAAVLVSVEAGEGEYQQALPETPLTIPLGPVTDLAIKSHTGSRDQVIPGMPPMFTYTFTVFNAGPSDARIANVTHHFVPKLKPVSWTCAATNGSCPASGQGEVDAKVSLSVGGSATFTVKGSASPAQIGLLLNAKTSVAVMQPDAKDPRLENNELAALAVPLTVADLAVTKVFRPADGEKPAYYEITIVNTGPSDVVGALVRDQPDKGWEAGASWTCTALNGSCGCLSPRKCTPDSAESTDRCEAVGSARVLKDKITLRVGGRITYMLPVTMVIAGRNVACVSIPPEKGIDPRPENNSDEASPP